MSDVDKLAAMCASPLEIEHAGVTYRLKPLTLGQYADMEQWAKQQPFVELERKLVAIGDKKLRERAKEKMLDKAIAQSDNAEWIADKMSSPEAVERLFGMMLKANHPDIEPEKVREILDIKGLVQVRAWCESLIGLDEELRKN